MAVHPARARLQALHPGHHHQPTALRRHLLSVRERGVAFDVQEFTNGACCIAAPVRDGRNALVAPRDLGPGAALRGQRSLIRVIRDLAAEASMELGAADRQIAGRNG